MEVKKKRNSYIEFRRNTVHTCMLLLRTYSQPSDLTMVRNSHILGPTPQLPALRSLSRSSTISLLRTVPRNMPTHTVVRHPLSLGAPHEPFLSRLARCVLPRRSAGHRLCDSLALIGECTKFDCVVRTSEEHDRIALVLRLFLRRWTIGPVVNAIDARR